MGIAHPRATNGRPYGFYSTFGGTVGADIIRPSYPPVKNQRFCHPPLGKGGLQGFCAVLASAREPSPCVRADVGIRPYGFYPTSVQGGENRISHFCGFPMHFFLPSGTNYYIIMMYVYLQGDKHSSDGNKSPPEPSVTAEENGLL